MFSGISTGAEHLVVEHNKQQTIKKPFITRKNFSKAVNKVS
jgi:hypothetical protein